MPLVIDKGPHGHCALGSGRDDGAASRLDIALVNNMPDAALEATERQFLTLLEAAAHDRLVRVKLFALPEIPRSEAGRHHVAARYAPFEDFWKRRWDGLIVTRTEPRVQDLAQEPYWPGLTRIIDWAEDNAVSAVWSCLAAHAAVLHLDGIRRQPLREKCFGLFACDKIAADALVAGIEFPLRAPHSRWNDLSEEALVACGYAILARSPQVGVDTFVRRRHGLFVFFQGHPEYRPETLLREYRRDVGRFLRGEQAIYPAPPKFYLDAAAEGRLLAFEERARCEPRPELMADFPAVAADHAAAQAWRQAAFAIYRNWLAELADRKARPPVAIRSQAQRQPMLPG